MKRRAVILVLMLVAAIAGSSFLYFQYLRYPPFPARLLPDEAEAYIYVDLRPFRRVTTIEAGSVLQDPEIAKFADVTGIVPERDIDELAMAVLPTSPGQAERRFSEAITGRFDAEKLAAFLRSRGQVAHYRGYDIFEVPREDRTVRAVIIDPRTVLVTNSASPDTIRAMIDRARAQHARLPRSGPTLISRNFKKIPLGSIAWAIVRLQGSEEYRALGLPIGISLPRGSDLIVSARALSSLELRAETDTTREDSAKKLADEVATYLTLFRAVQVSVGAGGADPDAKKFFDSMRVQRGGSKVVVTAEVPFGFLRKAAAQGSAPVTSVENPAQSHRGAEKSEAKTAK